MRIEKEKVKIRNPNIEIRNKLEIQKIKNDKLNTLTAEFAEHAEGKRPKSQGIMKKGVPFPTVSGNPKLSKDFQKKTSAFSAFSCFILLFSCAEDPGKEKA